MAPSKGVMLKKLPNVLQPLLRMLGMDSRDPPPNIPGVFTRLEAPFARRESMESWYNLVFNNKDTLDCRLHEVRHMKMDDTVQHEYLLFTIKFRDAGCESILRAERGRGENRESSSAGLSASVSRDGGKGRPYISSVTSSSRFEADDKIHFVTKSGRAYDQVKTKWESVPRVRTLTFSELKPSVHELATVLLATSSSQDMYDVGNTQCYWFARTVFDALQRLFRGSVEHVKEGGRWHGIYIHTVDNLDEVCDVYDGARAAWTEQQRQIREGEEARQRELQERLEEAAKVREAAEKDREAAEMDREAAKTDREAAKTDREAAKMDREAAKREREAMARERELLQAGGLTVAQLLQRVRELEAGPSTS